MPDLGDKLIDAITKRDIVKVIKGVPNKHTPNTKKTDKVETARRVFSILREIYRFALHNNYTEIDITATIDINAILPKREVKNFNAILNEQELKKMYKELFKDVGYKKTYLALQFLALAALRPGNVRGLMWEWIDWDKRIITIPKEQMKTEFRLPLTDKLIKILDTIAMFKPNKKGLIFFGRDYNVKM